MAGTRISENVSTKQRRIAEMAGRSPERSFLSLNHYMNQEWMGEAYARTRKDGATGVDGVTAEEYGRDLENNLDSLLTRAKSGTYRAPAVRRVEIPKEDGRSSRPIGIPTFEDKVLQRAVVMVLEPLYEQDFLDCSYGFRPGRSAHQALETLWQGLMSMGGGYVVELDIESFFDTLDHAKLREMLGQRVSDGVITRLIGKWLKAGVLKDGQWERTKKGTPQGGVISPLLANVYLHEVLDKWFAEAVMPQLSGRGFMVRYADDAVMAFVNKTDALRVMEVLPKRFVRYGLKLHPRKTRLVEFRPPTNGGGSESFDLLGFTHYWGISRAGGPVVKRKTAKDRYRRALKRIRIWCRLNRHRPVEDQHRALNRKLQGHYGYYGITGNMKALARFRHQVETIWGKWLARRSQRAGKSWERWSMLLKRYPLVRAHIVHSYIT